MKKKSISIIIMAFGFSLFISSIIIFGLCIPSIEDDITKVDSQLQKGLNTLISFNQHQSTMYLYELDVIELINQNTSEDIIEMKIDTLSDIARATASSLYFLSQGEKGFLEYKERLEEMDYEKLKDEISNYTVTQFPYYNSLVDEKSQLNTNKDNIIFLAILLQVFGLSFTFLADVLARIWEKKL